MKVRNLYKPLLFFLAIYSMSCASSYHLIEPNTLVYNEALDTLIGQSVEISYRYKILEAKDNKRFEKIAKRNGISMLAMRIANFSPDTLYFPEDIIIKVEKENLYCLEMDEAIDVLLGRKDYGDAYVDLGIEIENGWVALGLIGVGLTAMIIEGNSGKKLINEMEEYYLVYSSIPPGAIVSGLIALPVKSGAPLSFAMNK